MAGVHRQGYARVTAQAFRDRGGAALARTQLVMIRRRKRGLSVPVARWLNAGLAPLADRYLAAPRLFKNAPTPRLLAEHRSGRRNNARKLWPLLMAELWAERWDVDTEP